MLRTFSFLGIFLLLSSCRTERIEPHPLSDPSASFRVTFSEDKSVVHVEAEWSIDEPEIFTFVQGTPQLPDGEASFIKNLVMKDSTGTEVQLKNLGMGDWEHGARHNDRVTLSYDVELKHHLYSWPSGIDEVAFVRDDGVFFTGDALFIIPGERIKNIEITFDVPDNWTVSVPWMQTGNRSYRAEDYRDLVINCGFVGTHRVERVTIDRFELQIAIGGSQKKSKDLFVGAMTPALRAYKQMFGGSRFSRYLIVIHDDVQSDGGAFRSSFSQVIDGEANANSIVTWGHTMLHEIFHLWNGNTIVPAGQEEWFKEGATDYMTVKFLYSLGIFSEMQFFKAMENTYRKYVLARMMAEMAGRPPESLRDAGNEKAKNRLMVYGGGALAAMMLDIELRKNSGKRKGMEDLFVALYDQFGKTDRRYTLDDLIRISSELSGKEMKPFFDSTVTGLRPLDVRPYYTQLGLQLDTFVEEVYLSRKPDATNEQKKLFSAIFKK